MGLSLTSWQVYVTHLSLGGVNVWFICGEIGNAWIRTGQVLSARVKARFKGTHWDGLSDIINGDHAAHTHTLSTTLAYDRLILVTLNREDKHVKALIWFCHFYEKCFSVFFYIRLEVPCLTSSQSSLHFFVTHFEVRSPVSGLTLEPQSHSSHSWELGILEPSYRRNTHTSIRLN